MVERYQCSDCGAVFSEPAERSWKEDMNGDGWAYQTFTELFCPTCGSAEIDRYYEVEDDA